jgi:ABC-type sugar transport system ATPase subunit
MSALPADITTPSPEASATPLLVVSGVSKRFGITQALIDVSVSFREGEVHALMGENGAGKSTLGKVIAGLHRPDSGTISLAGRELKPGDLEDAFRAGVRIVHQELAQCPNLSVAENLCLHQMPSRLGIVKRCEMVDRAVSLLKDLAPEIDPEAPLGSLAPGRRQIVQIAASLDQSDARESVPGGSPIHTGPRVIIFDEPTSSLSVAEADRLMAIVRRLASQGLTCIYVSHRMGEIFQCCDRVTVLRDGKFVATNTIREIDESTLVAQMIGRKLDASQSYRRSFPLPDPDSDPSPPALEVLDISSPGKLRSVSLRVRAGEVVGVGGLVGAGRSELLDAIFGLDKSATGQVRLCGRSVPLRRPRFSIRGGMGYVPEDRRLQGLFFLLGVDENTAMPRMPILARLGVRNTAGERELVEDRFRRFQVKAASHQSTPGELSGGNQQKLLIARWMGADTRVLLLDEPTRGIDVGTKAEIYRLIRDAANSGLAVLLVSSEMPELLKLSDRIIVMCDGRVTGELNAERMTQENILKLATVGH